MGKQTKQTKWEKGFFPGAKEAPTGCDWFHEIKLDGYRLLCRRDGGRVDFFTRRGYNWTKKFPGIVDSVRRLPADQLWLDGELVVMKQQGSSCFASLQTAIGTRDQRCLAYYVFDLLYLDGKNLCGVPLESRKPLLSNLIGDGEWNLQYIDHIQGDGPEFFLAACSQGLEGIVSKRSNSIYRPGVRSWDWVRAKCRGYLEIRNVRS